MFQAGSRSRRVGTFMMLEDEAAFEARLAPVVAELGGWETHDQRARTSTPHDSLPDAMRGNGLQAFLRLRGEDGGPLIQYLRSTTTGGSASMRPGRLAWTWFPDDHADPVRQDFTTLADAVWTALRAVTSPHVTTADGRRGYRIGPAAKAWILAHPDRRLHDGVPLVLTEASR
ncbi:hypothetical protein J2S43_002166 [Catenuloplanes nepalensis]|uniref:DUF317 domain-containing protein n=1 Tax=Catenuloplanes nepalensis TaxID=587533 RepID=A0ABT9MQH9_9ACTN|nr:hypothetical protein [Catenuloplanes nepalensis]MDP9793654.1 hypothetical protein [Catenuloplanes nepalensis]